MSEESERQSEPQPEQPEQPDAEEGLLHGLPGAARWLPVAAFVLAAVGFEVLGPDAFRGEAGSFGEWGYVAGVGLVVALLLVVMAVADVGRLGGPAQARLFRRALREGRVPEQADREAWATEVHRRLEAGGEAPTGTLLRTAWVPVLGVVGVVVSLAAAASGGVVLVFVAVTLVGLALVAWGWLGHATRRERLRVLALELGA